MHVQHGEVRGATLASGQVLPPGGIAVGTEDLALTGADYIALGHIHKAQASTNQQRHGITYAGSAYPVNWGERGRIKSFAWSMIWASDEMRIFQSVGPILTIINRSTVPYGHPARIKLDWLTRTRMRSALKAVASVHRRRGCAWFAGHQGAGGLQRA